MAGIARNVQVDATDRFLAGEITVMLQLRPEMAKPPETTEHDAAPSMVALGRSAVTHDANDDGTVIPAADSSTVKLSPTERELASLLGDDILNVDLMRVREKASRTRALHVAAAHLLTGLEHGPATRVPIIASAVALGKEWRDEALRIARVLQLTHLEVIGWALLWAAPGTPEADEPDYPKDFERYRRRVADLFAAYEEAPGDGSAALLADSLAALEALSTASQKGQAWRQAQSLLASSMWGVDRGGASPVSALRERRTVTPSTLEAIVVEAPQRALSALEPYVETPTRRTRRTSRLWRS